MPTSLEDLLAGEDMIGGEVWCDALYNNLKNLLRSAPDIICVDDEVVCVDNEVATADA